MEEDTIVAISTALGVGAISIIRISGKKSLKIASEIFTKNLEKVASHTINYGYIIEDKKIIDEVLISVMKQPKTFTKEDVVEINCHGGIATTNKILELIIKKGARLAEPGEFTKRAFLNGRIDLIEAEGIMNLISSKTEKTMELSLNKLNGSTSNKIRDIRNNLVELISNIEVNIDYPEYDDVENLTNNIILPKIEKVKTSIESIIETSKDCKLIEEGLNVAIIGKPNVGKSSLLNKLLDEEKAIVTDIAGTTRDVVEGKIVLNGIVLNLVDTAGIRETDNVAEKIGVSKSINLIDKVDLVIYLLNNNDFLTEEDRQILEKINNKKHIIVVNKVDLQSNIDNSIFNENVIKMSIKNNKGIDELKQTIVNLFNLDNLETNDMTYLSNAREIGLLNQALESINNSVSSIINNTPIDLVEIEIKNCWNYLGEIIGESYTEELLDEMFARFCLGK